MIYLLDTTAFSALVQENAKTLARLARVSPADQVVICTITRGEVLYGLARLPKGKRRRALEAKTADLFNQFLCLSVPEAAGDHYAQLKAEMARQGTALDENDLWIAAVSLQLNGILVTSDSDFGRAGSLRLEDWRQ